MGWRSKWRARRREAQEEAKRQTELVVSDLEQALSDGQLKLKCPRCRVNDVVYVRIYETYQCQTCGTHIGRSLIP